MLDELYTLVLEGNNKDIAAKVQQALDEGTTPTTILNEALIEAMREIGQRFEDGEAFIPEMMIAARAMRTALEVLRPYLVDEGTEPVAKLVIGTVKGDLHDVGKTLVCMMAEGEGFEIVDLGIDVPPEQFVEAIREHQPDVVGMSALLTSTMMHMQTTVEAIEQAGLRDQVKIIIGGAPVSQDFAESIQVDGYAKDASTAARLARELIEQA